MISPWEFLAFFIALPIVGVFAWIASIYEPDGARDPDFEAWCRSAHPLLFAARCEAGRVLALRDGLLARVGPQRRVVHHRGRFPWTRYVFKVAVAVGPGGVLTVRAEEARVRLLRQAWPELGAVIDGTLMDVAPIGEIWLHTELRGGDDTRGEDRRLRGWTGELREGTVHDLVLSDRAPAWASGTRSLPEREAGMFDATSTD